MQKHVSRRLALMSLSAVAVLMAGCASVAVTDDSIRSNTAATLGISERSFTISDRVDSGARTDYLVNTHAGRQYSCYMTGTIAITGRAVSNAVCEPVGTHQPRAATDSSGKSCNALLKAAGRC
jgi:hypothetical protein